MNRPDDTFEMAARKADHAAQWTVDIREILQDRLGLKDPWASSIAAEIVAGMRNRLGGAKLYVPGPDLRDRDARIRDLFNGRNVRQLSELFGLSRSQVYAICARRHPGRPGEERESASSSLVGRQAPSL